MVPCSSCGLDLSVDLKVPTERSIAHKNRIWLMDFSTITVWLSSRFSYCWKFFFFISLIFLPNLFQGQAFVTLNRLITVFQNMYFLCFFAKDNILLTLKPYETFRNISH